MAAKQSAEMREALRLVAGGMSHTAAARQAGVGRTSLQAVLAREAQRKLWTLGQAALEQEADAQSLRDAFVKLSRGSK